MKETETEIRRDRQIDRYIIKRMLEREQGSMCVRAIERKREKEGEGLFVCLVS